MREIILNSYDVADALTDSGWLISQARDLIEPRVKIYFSRNVTKQVARLCPEDIVRGLPMMVGVWIVGEGTENTPDRWLWVGDFSADLFLETFKPILERMAGGPITSFRFVRQFHNDEWGIEFVLSVEGCK